MADELNPRVGSALSSAADDLAGSRRAPTENIKHLTEVAKELFDAGKQIADDVNHLMQRVEHASNLSSRLVKSPWVLAAGAIAAGAVLIRVSMRKS